MVLRFSMFFMHTLTKNLPLFLEYDVGPCAAYS